MAGRTKPSITDRDMTGLKYFEKLGSPPFVLERIH